MCILTFLPNSKESNYCKSWLETGLIYFGAYNFAMEICELAKGMYNWDQIIFVQYWCRCDSNENHTIRNLHKQKRITTAAKISNTNKNLHKQKRSTIYNQNTLK